MKTTSLEIAQAMVKTMVEHKRKMEIYVALSPAQKRLKRRIDKAIHDLTVIKGGRYYEQKN